MNIKVMYHSKGGNTKKVAEAIAEGVGTSAESISENIHFDALDILFIGDGVYGGKADIKTENFIKTLNMKKVKNAIVFGTYGGSDKAITSMKELLRKQGINVVDKSFGCRSRAWLVINRNHPDEDDLEAARKFAQDVVKEIKNTTHTK